MAEAQAKAEADTSRSQRSDSTSGPRTYSTVIRASDAAQFAQTVAQDGAKAAVKTFGADGIPHQRGENLSDHPARDPREFGRAGAYPRTDEADDPLVERLYDEVGVYGAVVDSWIGDTWDDGWHLDTENEAWIEQVREIEEEHDFKQLVRRADRRQFTYEDGYALLHARLRASNGEPSLQPGTVEEILELQAVNPTMVEDYTIETENADALGEITQWEVDFGQAHEGTTKVHPERVFHLRQQPDDDDPAKGTPWAKRIMDDVLGYENTKWAVFEAHFQRASPFLVAEVQEGVDLDEEDVDPDDILDAVDEIANANTQRILAEGFTLKPLHGASDLPDGSIPYDIAQRSISVSARIPLHELFGSAAGELASAEEDTGRYHKRVAKRREEFAKPLLEAWYERLAEWGLTDGVPDDLTIRWPALDEPKTKDVAETEKTRAEALALWKSRVEEDPPARLVDYEAGTFPTADEDQPGTDHAHDHGHGHRHPSLVTGQPLELVFVPDENDVLQAHPVFDYARAQAHTHAHDQAEEPEIPALKPVRKRFQNKIESVFLDWQDEALAIFEEEGNLPPLEGGDAARPDDPTIQALQAWDPDTTTLEQLLFDLLVQSGELGGMQTFEQLGFEETFGFIEGSTELETFSSIAEATADSQAQQLTTQIRREVAESLTEEESLRQTRDRILAVFDGDFDQIQANLIARTESMRGFNIGAKSALRQAGQDKARFQAFTDACPICSPLDDTEIKLNGDKVPPLHPRCRCTITILTDEVVA